MIIVFWGNVPFEASRTQKSLCYSNKIDLINSERTPRNKGAK